MSLIIRSSAIHAAGCYTMAPIRKGARVVEYTGPRISKDDADVKYEHSPTTYLFGVGDGTTVIDGHGTAMFINHSCDPNCESLIDDGRVFIEAVRTIRPGEEITYDYQIGRDRADPPNVDEIFACRCGAQRCRGSMLWPPRRRAPAPRRAPRRAGENT